MVQGLASGSVGSWHEVPRTSLAPIFRMAPVVVEQAPMGSRSPLRFGRCRTDVLWTPCNPSSTLKGIKTNYMDFVQDCISD